MDKYVFGIVIRTETGELTFQKYGAGALGETALWMSVVYPIYEGHGEFFSMPEAAFEHIKELQKREGVA